MSRRLSDSERRLWRRVARTVRTAPDFASHLAHDELNEPTPAEPAAALSRTGRQEGGRGAAPAPRPSAGGPLANLGSERRLRRGRLEVEARLDLHGHTQDSARAELVDFIARAQAMGCRSVLVITGKGRMGGGVLRARLLDWIAAPDIRPRLAGYAPAHARHGGEGAFYLLLKARKAD